MSGFGNCCCVVWLFVLLFFGRVRMVWFFFLLCCWFMFIVLNRVILCIILMLWGGCGLMWGKGIWLYWKFLKLVSFCWVICCLNLVCSIVVWWFLVWCGCWWVRMCVWFLLFFLSGCFLVWKWGRWFGLFLRMILSVLVFIVCLLIVGVVRKIGLSRWFRRRIGWCWGWSGWGKVLLFWGVRVKKVGGGWVFLFVCLFCF